MGNSYLILVTLLHLSSFHCIISQPSDYRIANLTNIQWTNNYSTPLNNSEPGPVRFILLRETSGPDSPYFACGFFYENYEFDTACFGVFISITAQDIMYSQLVWSANRHNLVGENATLKLTGDGDLVLRDADGTLVWSTNTAGRSVVGLNLTEMGNLVLYDKNNDTVWQSFDHPTDTLVLGQKLFSGQKLTASASETNRPNGVSYSLSVTNDSLYTSLESNPPHPYFQLKFLEVKENIEPTYATLSNGSFSLFITSPDIESSNISIPEARSVQYMKLESDGHLRVYDWVELQWQTVADVLAKYIRDCDYPMVCGRYGICSTRDTEGGAGCSCPTSTSAKTIYFKQIDDRHPNLGCSEVTPLSCNASKYQRLLELKNVTHKLPDKADVNNTDLESCKRACLKNCSCKAALFSNGHCYLPSEILSLADEEDPVVPGRNYHQFFVKVQDYPSALPPPSTSTQVAPKRKTGRNAMILAYSLGAFFGLFLIIGIFVFLLRNKKDASETEDDYLDQVPGMPMRFSYEELKSTTDDFSKKLGEGGFGSVFEGTLSNGTKIAVKCLDGLGQVKKSFLAEVETIGSIHHFNLVRLVGYCSEMSRQLLVYEFMCNGSLDRWIFHRNQELSLDWKIRRKIILDIAKGLAYLHDDCRQKIFHLDIKPQNILLDENFNAKVSDFGLSKLIDRDQSQVVTTLRGTPGYMAPEWSSFAITEKVDVYSFGVVVLEILCGRKNVDRSQPEEGMHLLSVFTRKAEEGQLLDMVDKYSEDMQLRGEEVVEMMRLTAWCLQGDFSKRPSMSVVLKVLEGSMDVEDDLEYNFINPPVPRTSAATPGASTPLPPSALSGPR